MDSKTKSLSIVIEALVVIAIVVAINYLAYFFFLRFDLTEGKAYSISDSTKSVLADLEDPVSAELFMSKQLPSQLITVRDELVDKLKEFEVYSKGKFQLKITDPGDDTEIKERAQSLMVPEFDVQVTEKSQLSVRKVFMGLALSYGDKNEAIGQLIDPTTLEYEVTSRLVRLTIDEKPKIGFFNGFFQTNEQQQPPQYQALQQVLGGQQGLYEIVEIDSQKDRKLPEGLKGLIVCGAFGMSDSLKYSIDQFLLSGGQVIIAMDPIMEINQQMGLQQAYPSLPTIEDQLEKYGLRFEKKLIFDEQCGQASFRSGPFVVRQSYQLWPAITPEGFNKDVAAVAKQSMLTMPWTCPIEKVEVEGSIVKELAKTSPKSYLLSSPFDLKPDQDWEFLKTTSEKQGPFNVAMLVEGAIPSAFPGGPPAAQARPPAEGEEGSVSLDPVFDANQQLKEGTGTGRLVVMSSTRALSDQFMQQFQDNILFLVNVVDSLLLDERLMNIRSAQVTQRPLQQLDPNQQQFYRWTIVLGVPVLLVLLGLLLWFLRGKRRQAIARRWAA
jgi:gliding-associated putative ABC transporter substrate-binding component GldG